MVRVLVVYDISDDGDRQRVSRTLEAWGLSRIQRSAFTGVLQRARVRDLARRVERLINTETDVVHIVPVQPADWARVLVLGKPKWAARVGGSYELLY